MNAVILALLQHVFETLERDFALRIHCTLLLQVGKERIAAFAVDIDIDGLQHLLELMNADTTRLVLVRRGEGTLQIGLLLWREGLAL